MKKSICLLLMAAIVLSTICFVFASEMGNANTIVQFDINGTIGNCTAIVNSPTDYIEATMELRRGATVIDSWDASGTGSVTLSETASLARGYSYTLIVYGTTNGTSFPAKSITKMCR